MNLGNINTDYGNLECYLLKKDSIKIETEKGELISIGEVDDNELEIKGFYNLISRLDIKNKKDLNQTKEYLIDKLEEYFTVNFHY